MPDVIVVERQHCQMGANVPIPDGRVRQIVAARISTTYCFCANQSETKISSRQNSAKVRLNGGFESSSGDIKTDRLLIDRNHSVVVDSQTEIAFCGDLSELLWIYKTLLHLLARQRIIPSLHQRFMELLSSFEQTSAQPVVYERLVKVPIAVDELLLSLAILDHCIESGLVQYSGQLPAIPLAGLQQVLVQHGLNVLDTVPFAGLKVAH